MANLLNSDVMLGLMSANSSSSLQQVSTKEYYKAKNSGNEGAMASSMGYATDFRDKAMTAVEESREALAERAKEVSEEERLEKEQMAKTARASAAQSVENPTSVTQTDNRVQSAIPSEQSAATLELSQEYHEYYDNLLQTGAVSEAESVTPIAIDDMVKIPVTTKKIEQAHGVKS